MPTYAVKVGEIILQSDSPITEGERKQAINHIRRNQPVMRETDGVQIKIRFDVPAS